MEEQKSPYPIGSDIFLQFILIIPFLTHNLHETDGEFALSAF
jgi:hypothetical protein